MPPVPKCSPALSSDPATTRIPDSKEDRSQIPIPRDDNWYGVTLLRTPVFHRSQALLAKGFEISDTGNWWTWITAGLAAVRLPVVSRWQDDRGQKEAYSVLFPGRLLADPCTFQVGIQQTQRRCNSGHCNYPQPAGQLRSHALSRVREGRSELARERTRAAGYPWRRACEVLAALRTPARSCEPLDKQGNTRLHELRVGGLK